MQKPDIHEAPSLISCEASTAIKGLLMLLIVFGHIAMLTTNFATGGRTFFWHWLYSFHVYVFFVLPFIYGYSKKKCIGKTGGGNYIDNQQVINDLKRNLVKIGVPYCWFFLFSSIVFVTFGGGQFNLQGMLYAFFFGNEPLMGMYVGFNFLWFLPAILALMTLKSVYYNSNKTVKIIIIGISLILWTLSLFKVADRYTIGNYVPFSVSQAFYFILLGLVARYIVEKRWPIKFIIPVIILLIGLMTYLLYILCYRIDIHTIISLHTIIRLFLPILMFLFLYYIQNILVKSKILNFIGTYSLQIYLVHVFVINALVVLFTHFAEQSIGLGLVIYVLALAISCGLAWIMMKMPIINKVVFPTK